MSTEDDDKELYERLEAAYMAAESGTEAERLYLDARDYVGECSRSKAEIGEELAYRVELAMGRFADASLTRALCSALEDYRREWRKLEGFDS